MPASPFRIKICGITRAPDCIEAINAGADAIGLNFYQESSRFVDDEAFEQLQSFLFARDSLQFVLNRRIETIGVFVNETTERIAEIAAELRLSGIQLHGDEPPEFLASLPTLPIVRARRMDDRGVAAIADDLRACQAAGRLPDAVLVDAMTPGRYGGTGETLSWAGLADYRTWLGDAPLILAGGLTPENVADAIRTVRPAGVDVASGVESSPGVKNHAKMHRFIDAAKAAFESL